MKGKSILESLNRFIVNHSFAGIIIALFSFTIIFLFSLTDFYQVLELKLYDMRFRIKPSIEEWNRIAMVEIDDNSIFQKGKFPWPRRFYGEGMSILSRAGVAATVFDIEFPDPSPYTVLDESISYLEHSDDNSSFSKDMVLNNLILNNDKIFSDSLRESGNVFLAYSFQKFINTGKDLDELSAEQREYLKKGYEHFLKYSSVEISSDEITKYRSLMDRERNGIAYPIPIVGNTTNTFGFVDSDFDMDGSSRRIRLVRLFKNRLFFHLSLVVSANLLDVKIEDIKVIPGESITLKNARNPVTGREEDIIIPVDNQGKMLIHWAGDYNSSFKHVPYISLFLYDEYREGIYSLYDFIDTNYFENKLKSINNEIKDMESKLNKKPDFTRQVLLENKLDSLFNSRSIHKDEIMKKYKELRKEALLNLTDENQLRDERATTELNIEVEKLVRQVDGLRKNIVIKGLTATGTQDLGVTPLSSNYWMVGTYPNIINTIMQNSFIKKVPNYVNLLIFLIIAISISIFIKNLSAKESLFTIGLVFLFINIAIILFFTVGHIWVDQLGSVLSAIIPSVSILSVKFLKEESKRRFIKNAFSRYLSESVIDVIIKNPETLHLGGSDRDISVFFSDIQGFSTISEKLTPPQLVKLLNEYLSEMTDIILSSKGTVDKFEGDAIMAFYGAPQFHPNHPLQACLAAIEMQKRLVDMRKVWKKKKEPLLYVRMGINTGTAVVGNMGSNDRMDYTAMGDSVNLASRLEGANKYYGTYTMISSYTYEHLNDKIACRELDTIRVVGKEEPIKVFELLDRSKNLTDQMMEMLALYHFGLDKFKTREWKEAKKFFNKALKIIEDDGPSLAYVKRCTEFIKSPPSKKWDGVYTLKSK